MTRLASILNLRSGSKIADVRADDMRALAEIAEAFDTMNVQSPLQLSRSNGRAALSLEDAFLRRTPSDRQVVVVAVTPPTLQVREVRYADRPPSPPPPPEPLEPDEEGPQEEPDTDLVLEFVGAPFDAYPWYSASLEDYEGSVHEDATVDRGTPMFRAIKRDVWLVVKPVVGAEVRSFILTGMNKDHVLAEPVGGGDEVKIAKPYKLRMNPFHLQTVDGKDYVYFGSTKRRVSLEGTDVSETQIVIPAYRIPPGDDRSDLIWATKTTTFMDYGLLPPLLPEDLEWLDLNVDGRAWAQVAPA